MKNIVILLFIGQICFADAAQLLQKHRHQIKQQFFDEDFKPEDNQDLVTELVGKISVDGEKSENLERAITQNKQMNQNQILNQLKSDPIYGSLGKPAALTINQYSTEEEKMEYYLSLKKPVRFELDSDVVATNESIETAKKYVGKDFEFPEDPSLVPDDQQSFELAKKISSNYELDKDVKSTLLSAKYAEQYYKNPTGKNHPRNQYPTNSDPENWMTSTDKEQKQIIQNMIASRGYDTNKLTPQENERLLSEMWSIYEIEKGNEAVIKKFGRYKPPKKPVQVSVKKTKKTTLKSKSKLKTKSNAKQSKKKLGKAHAQQEEQQEYEIKVDGQNVKLGNESEDENDQFVKPAVHVQKMKKEQQKKPADDENNIDSMVIDGQRVKVVQMTENDLNNLE